MIGIVSVFLHSKYEASPSWSIKQPGACTEATTALLTSLTLGRLSEERNRTMSDSADISTAMHHSQTQAINQVLIKM